jgi:uncharacterized protein YodC (DUF2158 family)
MTDLKPGDLVILKSGGPVMTVDTVNTDIFDDNKITGVLCAWFVGNKLERARFDRDAITPASPQSAPVGETDAPSPEAAGEYKIVLDEMATAMNEAAEPADDKSERPIGRAKRTSAKKHAADPSSPAANGTN